MESAYVDSFASWSKRFARISTGTQVVAQLPKSVLEALAFGGMVAMIIYLLASGLGVETVLPTIGVFAFAAYRLMPALQDVFSGAASIRANAGSVELLASDFELSAVDQGTSPPLSTRSGSSNTACIAFRELRLDNVTFSFPGAPVPLFDSVCMWVVAGERIALVGPTGAGKSTLLDIILGLLEPEAGAVLVNDVPQSRQTVQRWHASIGYVAQSMYTFDDTVAGNIAVGIAPEYIDRRLMERAARLASIHDFITGLPQGYDTPVGEGGIRLSGGQRQRLGIARALYRNLQVLVLDEATSALDPSTERKVLGGLLDTRQTRTVVMVSHRIESVRGFDRIYVIDGGRIVHSGSYDDLSRESPEFRELAHAPEPGRTL